MTHHVRRLLPLCALLFAAFAAAPALAHGNGHHRDHRHDRHDDRAYRDCDHRGCDRRGCSRYDRRDRYDRHFRIPARIDYRSHRYDDYYRGRSWYRGHRHHHRVYEFPVWNGRRYHHRDTFYCDGVRFYPERHRRGSIGYQGRRYSFEIDF